MKPHVFWLRGPGSGIAPTRVLIVFACAIALGLLSARLFAVPTHATQVGRIDAGGAQLSAATLISPFRIRQPSWLPPGLELRSANYNPPTTAAGGVLFAIDLHYAGAGSDTLHVWETNIPNLAQLGKDPTAEGKLVQIGNTAWRAVFIDDARGPTWVLSARQSDGVTVSIDTSLGEATLERVAASLE